jgi:glycine cleavage system aminomethyltransferase T
MDECMVGRSSGGEWRLVCSGSENEHWWGEGREDDGVGFRGEGCCREVGMGTFLVCGPRIYEWFSKVIGEVVLKDYEWRRVDWERGSIELWRGNFIGGESCLVCGEDWVIRRLWDAGAKVCVQMGGKICGWDAYNIWRQEAGLPLCGVDLLLERSVFEVGLDAWVSMNKGNFVGRDYLVAEQANGVGYRWVALKSVSGGGRVGDVAGRGSGALLKKDGAVVGSVTCQCMSPVLRGWLGLGYVKRLYGKVGEVLDWDVRGRVVRVQVVRRPVFLR